MMANDLLREYLAWQGEIGSDEVILPHPMARKQAVAATAAASAVSTPVAAIASNSAGLSHTAIEEEQPAGFQHAPAFQPTSPSNLFGDLSRALEAAGKIEKEDGLPQARFVRTVEASNLPAFLGLQDYWEYLEKHSRTLFASESEIRILRGQGPEQSPLSLVSLEPGENDAAEDRLFTGEAGTLLEKMMRAIRLDTAQLYRTSLAKHHAKGRTWSRRDWVRLLPLLHIELALAKVPMVLLLGEACAQAVLKTSKTMDELRQTPHREGGRDFAVTYHPDELLKRDELKRKAWEDLQWLQRRMTQTVSA
jgi:uracil-DNA glycosylase family 4